MPALLSSADLDGICSHAASAPDPRPYQRELVDAVEHGRLADPADTPYALGLAADIAVRCHDEPEALSLARRAVDAAEGTTEHGRVLAHLAELLLRFGQADEGTGILRSLWPRLVTERSASGYVVDALLAHGHSELSERWLTTALSEAMTNAETLPPGTEGAEDAWRIIEGLALRRRDVRHDLGLEPDDTDLIADGIASRHDSPDLLFWPEELFIALLAATEDDDEVRRASWDAHRAEIELDLRAAAEQGDDLVVEVGTPALLAAALAGDDAEHVPPGPVLAWPPVGDARCWCGSGTPYRRCCLPRAAH